MTASNIIASLALAFAFASFVVSLLLNLKLHRENRNHQDASFNMDRNVKFEGMLLDWPGGFEIQGVDVEAAEADGIRKDHMTYLITSLNALSSYTMSTGETVYDNLKGNEYRHQMFSNEVTRRTWKHVRVFFRRSTQEDVDAFLREKYPPMEGNAE